MRAFAVSAFALHATVLPSRRQQCTRNAETLLRTLHCNRSAAYCSSSPDDLSLLMLVSKTGVGGGKEKNTKGLYQQQTVIDILNFNYDIPSYTLHMRTALFSDDSLPPSRNCRALVIVPRHVTSTCVISRLIPISSQILRIMPNLFIIRCLHYT